MIRTYRWNSVEKDKGRRRREDEDGEYKSNKTNFLILFKRERRRLITVLNWCFSETNRDKLRLERSAYRESRSGLYTGITMFAKRRRQIFLVLFYLFFFFLKRDSKKIKLIAKKFLLRCKKLTGIYLFTDYSKDKISDIFEEIEYPWKIFIGFSCTNQYIYIHAYVLLK